MNREALHARYAQFIDAGNQHTETSKATGIPAGSLRAFLRDGSLGPERREALSAYLNGQGQQLVALRSVDPELRGYIAARLRTVADLVERDCPPEEILTQELYSLHELLGRLVQ